MQKFTAVKSDSTHVHVYTSQLVPVVSLYPNLTLLFFGIKSSDLSLVKSDRVNSDARSHCHFNSDTNTDQI